jgi:hypothetical protein
MNFDFQNRHSASPAAGPEAAIFPAYFMATHLL